MSPARTVDHRGTTISFDDDGNGPPVVLLHSFLCSRKIWEVQARYDIKGLDLTAKRKVTISGG